MIRSVRMLVAASSAALTLGLAYPAWADDCPLSDPTCLTGDLVAPAGDSVTDVVPDVVGDAVDDPNGTVEPVVKDVVAEVNRLAAQIGEPPPGEGGGGPTGNGGGDGSGAGGAGLTDARLQNGTGLPGSTVLLASSAADPDIPIARGGPRLRDRVTAAVAAAARSFAVVLVLLGVAIGFVLVQDRLDRKDPKLVLAPVGSDVVLFA